MKGDRDEIQQWIFAKWKANGWVIGGKFNYYFDYFCRDKGGAPRDPYYPAMVEEQYYIGRKYRAQIEIHGVLGNDDINRYASSSAIIRGKKISFNRKRALYSTDGDLRMTADYDHIGEDSEGNAVDHTDRKLDTVAGKPFFPDNYQMFWDTYFPKYKGYVKPPKPPTPQEASNGEDNTPTA